VFEDRRDVAEADEDGGGRDEEYEINSMGKPSGTGTTRNGRDGIATYEDNKKRLWFLKGYYIQ
jgi:hypothetical protein